VIGILGSRNRSKNWKEPRVLALLIGQSFVITAVAAVVLQVIYENH
jgi:hypothetical protein